MKQMLTKEKGTVVNAHFTDRKVETGSSHHAGVPPLPFQYLLEGDLQGPECDVWVQPHLPCLWIWGMWEEGREKRSQVPKDTFSGNSISD